MFQARRKDNNEIILADDLKVIDNVSDLEFVCIDPNCAIDLIACSFGEHNKKRPFFKKHKNSEHNASCAYGKYLLLLEHGKKRALTTEELEDMDYPSQLVMPAKKAQEIDTTTKEDLPKEDTESTRKASTGEYTEVASTLKKVTAIDQIVDFYLSCPYNRGIDLNLLGNSAPYRYQFRRIWGENIGNYKNGKIFYGIINLGLNPVINRDGKTRIRLHECAGWETDSTSRYNDKSQVNPYWVEIDNDQLSKHKLSRIIKTRESVANESKGTWLKSKKNDGKDAFIFFLGEAPSENEPYVFKANGGFVTFRYTEILPTKDKPA